MNIGGNDIIEEYQFNNNICTSEILNNAHLTPFFDNTIGGITELSRPGFSKTLDLV